MTEMVIRPLSRGFRLECVRYFPSFMFPLDSQIALFKFHN